MERNQITKTEMLIEMLETRWSWVAHEIWDDYPTLKKNGFEFKIRIPWSIDDLIEAQKRYAVYESKLKSYVEVGE